MKHYLVHKSNGKVEVSDEPKRGTVSYVYDENKLLKRDLKEMFKATKPVLGPEDTMRFILEPSQDGVTATVVLDIRNRSNIELGTFLMHYG